jgi:hypothetical protein
MGFPLNPPNTPLVQADGRSVSPEWYKYFLAIQRMIGGPSDPFDDSGFLSGIPSPPPQPSGDEGLDAPPVQIVVAPAEPLIPPVQQDPAPDVLLPPPMPVPATDDLMHPYAHGA